MLRSMVSASATTEAMPSGIINSPPFFMRLNKVSCGTPASASTSAASAGQKVAIRANPVRAKIVREV